MSGFAAPGGGTPDGPEFSQLGDELAYVFPSDAGLTCIAISINLRSTRVSATMHGLVSTPCCDGTTACGIAMRRAVRRGGCSGAGPNRTTYVAVRDRAGRSVGDAGLHQDPWTGAGMDSAASTAALLVEARDGSAGSDDWMETFHQRRDEKLLDGFHETVSGAADLSAIAG